MSRAKKPQKRKIFFYLIFILLLNAAIWFFYKDNNLIELLYEYSQALPVYQLDKVLLLFLTILLGFLFYSLGRWRDNAQRASLAQQHASKDVLTKLYNRRGLESKILIEWQRFSRYKEPFCLIMIHIDDLKAINNSLGHQEGDRIIIEVAEKLARNTRTTDFCARWSGADFLIFCPVTDLASIGVLAERLRADVYRLLKDGIELSISLGVSQADSNKSLKELFKSVELQTYKAKKTGGNCIVCDQLKKPE